MARYRSTWFRPRTRSATTRRWCSFCSTSCLSTARIWTGKPLAERKSRLAKLLTGAAAELQYRDHQQGRGPEFSKWRCSNSHAHFRVAVFLGLAGRKPPAAPNRLMDKLS